MIKIVAENGKVILAHIGDAYAKGGNTAAMEMAKIAVQQLNGSKIVSVEVVED